MRRLVVAPVLASLAFLAPSVSAAPAVPQVTDPADDANFVNSQNNTGPYYTIPNNTQTPVGSQSYADVLSVRWSTVKSTKKVGKKTVTTVTGFQVTTTLKGDPTPPSGTTIVYRMLGSTPTCGFFGVVYYTTPLSDPTTPQSAVRDNCNESPTRLTKIANPVIKDKTITWTVPLSVIPKDTKVGLNSVLTGLYFTVVEIEDFKGQRVPDGVPVYGGATGLGVGVIDDSRPGDAVYKIGS